MPNLVIEFQGAYRFLSNFYPVQIWCDGEVFASVEHAYQASKATNKVERHLFTANGITPGLAKRMGRNIRIRPDWEQVKLDIMTKLVSQKFINKELQGWLLNTGDMELQEGNRWGDTYWGVDLRSGKGQNNLGKILMKVRKELQDA